MFILSRTRGKEKCRKSEVFRGRKVTIFSFQMRENKVEYYISVRSDIQRISEEKTMPTIYWAGDSTVQYNDISSYPQTGIGQVMQLFLKREVAVKNYAKNGRSTKSFIDESRMVPIYDQITEGDFLFIQFGHNDEKIKDKDRYTDPFGEFKVNLGKFIHVARNKKAYPVLITPLERRFFEADGRVYKGEHGDYVEAMKQVAAEQDVPLIDLNAMSRRRMEEAGDAVTRTWYMHLPAGKYPNFPEGKEDNTHLQYEGAVTYADCIARGLEQIGGIYADLLNDRQKPGDDLFSL